jgi:hypothetical protein
MAAIKVTRIQHDYVPLEIDMKGGSPSVGEAINDAVLANLLDGASVMSVGIEFEEREWEGMLKEFHSNPSHKAAMAMGVAEPIRHKRS